MTYREQQRLADIQAAIDAIRSHLQRGDLTDGLVFDAVRIRLLEIGEAVKALPAERLSSQAAIRWAQIARLRDHLAHRTSTPTTRSCRLPSTMTCPNWNALFRRWRRPCQLRSSKTKIRQRNSRPKGAGRLSWRQAGQVQSPGGCASVEVRDVRRREVLAQRLSDPGSPGLDLAALRSITKAVQAASEGNE